MKQSPFANQHPIVNAQIATPPGYRMVTADLTVSVTAEPAGPFSEWPQNVIDGVMFALERLNDKAKHTGGAYTLLTAEAGTEIEGDAWVKLVAYRYVPKVLQS